MCGESPLALWWLPFFAVTSHIGRGKGFLIPLIPFVRALLSWHSEWSEWVKSLSHVQLFATPWTEPARLLYPWDSPGKNTGVGCHFLLQEIFWTQESNLGLLHCRQILYLLSQQGANFKCSSSKHKTCPGASALQFLLVLLAKCCPISHLLSQGGFSLCRWNKGSVSFHHLCPFSSFSEDCSIEEAPLQTWRVFSVAST